MHSAAVHDNENPETAQRTITDQVDVQTSVHQMYSREFRDCSRLRKLMTGQDNPKEESSPGAGDTKQAWEESKPSWEANPSYGFEKRGCFPHAWESESGARELLKLVLLD